jgi:hypothetical protein
MGGENDLGPLLVADLFYNYFMGSVFESLVVGILTLDANVSIKSNLQVVD